MKISKIDGDGLPTRKLNRLAKKLPASGLFWCWKCDRGIVGLGGKCKTCGARNGSRRMKNSETPI